ncbi:hypothetical protein LOK74_02375 [Brevibacillus humidisoli]|uniref:hypothetical protein n=1 Tax=Brevibacillus humidisoli TaxID=2895522 RepID=UPI001E632165|nr:hypothetical protein [Brevibacillus humidisoli]UFJ41404.1 hypothetical protein LOK74_02375 [Brevibacillus humidisoli]
MSMTSERWGASNPSPFDGRCGITSSRIAAAADKRALLQLAAQGAERDDLSHAAKVMNAYFKLVKNSQASTLPEDLFIGVYLLSLWQERVQQQHPSLQRKADFLCRCLESLSAQVFAQVIEQIYQYSKQHQTFVLMFAVLDRAVERFQGQREKLFRLWAKNSSAWYYMKDYQKGYESSLNALQYCDHADETSLSHLLIRHGNLCLQLKKYKEALFSYLKGYNLLDHKTNSFSLACKVNIGRTYFKLYDYENARGHWEEVLAHTSADDAIRINLLTDFAFLELTKGDYTRGRALYYETERLLSRLTESEREAYAIEAILHQRNGALLLYPRDPRLALKQMLESAYKMITSPLKDEIFETVYLMVVFLAKYGNICDEDDLRKLENLRKYID